MVELIGYIASVLIAVSMWMKSLLRLRLFSMVGSALFSVYGLLIGSIPVFALNALSAAAHVYYLTLAGKKEAYFELMIVPDKNAPFLKRFLEFYRDDIQKFFPNFSLEKTVEPHIFVVFRDMVPVGVFVAEPKDQDSLEILIDYVTPGYRDFKNSHYVFYRGKKLFGGKGYQRYYTRSNNAKHQKYLKKMGFRPVMLDNEEWWTREI